MKTGVQRPRQSRTKGAAITSAHHAPDPPTVVGGSIAICCTCSRPVVAQTGHKPLRPHVRSWEELT